MSKGKEVRRGGLLVIERTRFNLVKCPACFGKAHVSVHVPMLNSTIVRNVPCEICERGYIEASWSAEIAKAVQAGTSPQEIIDTVNKKRAELKVKKDPE